MLRARVLTALLLLGLTLAAIYLLPQGAFALLLGGVVLACGWEWSRLAGLESTAARGGAVAVLALAMLLIETQPAQARYVLWLASGFWVFAVFLVVRYPRDARWLSGVPVALMGLPVLVGAWWGLCAIRGAAQGGHWLLWLFCLVWGADIGAYFAGRQFGRRKLAPAVSPGKTWEGVFGGALLSLGLTWTALALQHALKQVAKYRECNQREHHREPYRRPLVGQRQRGVKDSGSLLPGHGGLLDRVDALLPVLPVFALLQPLLLTR